MANQQSQRSMRVTDTERLFSSAVRPNPDGGWLTEVSLCDGATLTKWFPTEDDARRYPDELASWLERGRGGSGAATGQMSGS